MTAMIYQPADRFNFSPVHPVRRRRVRKTTRIQEHDGMSALECANAVLEYMDSLHTVAVWSATEDGEGKTFWVCQQDDGDGLWHGVYPGVSLEDALDVATIYAAPVQTWQQNLFGEWVAVVVGGASE